MRSLKRSHVLSSAELVTRILERPGLAAAVRELPGPVLGKLIAHVGLEDAGDLVALASTAQLAQVFDDDLWRADRAGEDETFQPARFALWLRVMLDAGEDVLAQRLVELPQDLVALAFHRLVLVLDMDVLGEELADAGEEAADIEHALETSAFEEWEEFRVIARQPDVWDDAWTALLSLDRDHHERLRALLEQCCAMTTEYISGQGGLFHVLTAEEMLDGDVAASREDRRSAEGFVSPADARAFLALAKRHEAAEGPGERDPITRAYFRNLGPPSREQPQGTEGAAPPAPIPATPTPGNANRQLAETADVHDLAALLREAELTAAPMGPLSKALTSADSRHGRLIEEAMSALRERDAVLFSKRVQELGYLMNVWIAGGTQEGLPPRPTEALELVLETCETGLRARLAPAAPTPELALGLLMSTPADILFRQGFSAPASSPPAPG